MKFLKALLAIFTFLAVALTGALLFVQDKSAPRYIQIYTNEQKPTTHTAKAPERHLPSRGFLICGVNISLLHDSTQSWCRSRHHRHCCAYFQCVQWQLSLH